MSRNPMGMSRSVMTTFWSLGSRCCHHEMFPSLPWSNLHEHESSPPIGLLMAILLSARPLEFSASGFSDQQQLFFHERDTPLG